MLGDIQPTPGLLPGGELAIRERIPLPSLEGLVVSRFMEGPLPAVTATIVEHGRRDPTTSPALDGAAAMP